MFDVLKTGIDGLDAILGGGIRYPTETAAFALVTGGPGCGKTLLALELVVRAWLGAGDGTTCLYYSVEQSPDDLYKKMTADFAFYGTQPGIEVTALPREVPHKLCLEATTPRGMTRLVLTHANPADLAGSGQSGPVVDIDWIIAEIGNYRLAGSVGMVCIDNVGLLMSDLDYFAKRTKLVATRHTLMSHRVHGVFVQEESGPRDLRTPSAEEFSTDLLIRLSLQELGGFKARVIEILKARHQYYYRGAHHFSIAGRGVHDDEFLGARGERGPGMHIYPSVAAQLSIERDRTGGTPRRGSATIDLGQPDLNAPFLHDTGPTRASSSVLLAEPGTRYTYLALRFLAAGLRAGEPGLMVSTKEDPDMLRRICAREPQLADACLDEHGAFVEDLHILYLHPEDVSPGKFTWDVLCKTIACAGPQGSVRVAFDNIFRLQDRFPLIDNQTFLLSALLDLLAYQGATPLFVDLAPPGSGSSSGRADFSPASYMTAFDNVFHLYLTKPDDGDEQRPFVRVLKSIGNEFRHTPRTIDYRRA